MSCVKYINYDSTDVDSVLFDKRIADICTSSYRIDANQIIVSYSGGVKDLYDNLSSLLEGKNILIIEFTQTGYYGYHNSSLWRWLKDQFDKELTRKE